MRLIRPAAFSAAAAAAATILIGHLPFEGAPLVQAQLETGDETVPAPIPPAIKGKADLVRVDKSARLLQLMRNGTVIASYPVALGDAPEGHKMQEGDERTPEGRYVIDWRNPNSSYFLSLHISYPNAQDRARARAAGVSPGGDIMIHGQPNGFDASGSGLQKFDWTNGCIAVTNAQMEQIWDAVPDGTPIEITP